MIVPRLVACNIYISSTRPWLLSLLDIKLEDAVLVHAYADPVYDRSSLHLCGTPPAIVAAATEMASRAMQELRQSPTTALAQDAHPTVGPVDHIAVLPLVEDEPTDIDDETGWTAREIGSHLQRQHDDLQVLYYGAADPDHTPLATVRRTQTAFFRSTPPDLSTNVCTIGAPPHFVENFNIHVQGVTRSEARALTRMIRQPDLVEALTLPYRNGWEVACNLLQPTTVDATQLQTVVNEWQADHPHATVVRAYRVGTTAAQCRAAWDHRSAPRVMEEFRQQLLPGATPPTPTLQ